MRFVVFWALMISKSANLRLLSFPKSRLALFWSVVIGIISIISIYSFFYASREAVRILSAHFGSFHLIVLSSKERFIYNWFFSGIAVVIGVGFAFIYYLKTAQFYQSKKGRFRIRRSINEQRLNIWYFLFWFGECTSLLAVWYISTSFQYDFSFLRDHGYLMVLLPFVLYLNLWPQAVRIFKRNAIKAMLILLPLLIVISAVLANINLIDPNSLNKNFLVKEIRYQYNLEIPRSDFRRNLYSSYYSIDLYLAYPKSNNVDDPVIVVGPPYQLAQQISMDKVDSLWHEFNSLRSHQDPWVTLTANLHIDKNVPMSLVRKLQFELRIASALKVLYSTAPEQHSIPADHPSYHYSGIFDFLQPVNPLLVQYVDTTLVGKMPPTDNKFFRDNTEYTNMEEIKSHKNILAIRIENGELNLNGSMADWNFLNDSIVAHIKRFPNDYLFWIDLNGTATYQQYIDIQDEIHSTITGLRNKYALEKYGQSMDSRMLSSDDKSKIRETYPVKIRETTLEEVCARKKSHL